ncbi:tRNA (cytidine(34)-2'-O)-methyltransferase [bacterium]|nr:tRNA (cytidine(34)-2'-O)-methyltransferase [bacterium]NBX82388.1 tRNA (cytidine(34)-2'-O)-methyltransferase [bacterium]
MDRETASDFHLVLYEPKIPQNTGSIARLCACTGATLHLIHPLGFQVDEASVRRAGLDYWPHVKVVNHENWESFMHSQQPKHMFFFSKFGNRSFWNKKLSPPVYLVLGSETDGLPEHLWKAYPEQFLKVPMRTDIVRSLNLAQCAAVVLYESLRQFGFSAGLTSEGN